MHSPVVQKKEKPMRRRLLAVILTLAPAPLLAASFDLSLDETNGERIVVVARAGGGVFAVAAGGDDLKVLKGEDAERARARLVAIDDALDDDPAPDADGGKTKKKIVIHKVNVDEDAGGAGEEERVIRLVRKADDERREETLIDDGAEPLLKDEGDPEKAVERRVIRMNGADEARAIRFIDETKGLDEGEKAEMKAAAGL